MADINTMERENASVRVSVKMRERLQSVPDNLFLKTPVGSKQFLSPQQSGRKVLGARNTITLSAMKKQNRCHNIQEAQVKQVTCRSVENYPDIEKFHPYDPLDFEENFIPEDFLAVSCVALPGITDDLPQINVEAPETFTPSPRKCTLLSDNRAELDSFLEMINELTVDLPLEHDYIFSL